MKRRLPTNILLRSFLSLVLTFLVLIALVGIALAYYHYFPSTSAEGSAWGNLDDSLSLMVLSGFFSLVALIWWTVKCIGTMINNRNSQFVLWTHTFLLLLVYGSLVFVFFWKN
jgi:hypothetical protein